MSEKLYASILKYNGIFVVVKKGPGPLDEIVEKIPCLSMADAEKKLRIIKKEIGAWY